MNQDNTSGRRWARATLTGSLFASIVGNVAHTVLADSTISLGLRVPAAVIWPLATFFAIEVLVRMIWAPRASHKLARFMLVTPAIPAAVTSYEHLHALLLLMGEKVFIAWIGPAAVDGLMIGCTMALLFTRRTVETIADVTDGLLRLETLASEQERMAETMRGEALMSELENDTLPEAPVSPAPMRSRAPRGEVSPALKEAVSALLSGQKAEEGPGASRAVIGRYAKVLRTLRDNPHAPIDCATEKVREELVNVIRAEMRMGATR